MPDGFVLYKPKNLKKINDMRRAASLPTSRDVPIPTKGQVLFMPAAAMNNEPASCYNCVFMQKDNTCQLHGPAILVQKFIQGSIEFWPCCGYFVHGEPSEHDPHHHAELDPSTTGLVWINAPDKGQELGGATCGGLNGGDDCDWYNTKGTDKRAVKMGWCQVLQCNVEGGAVCAEWADDDQIEWQIAQIKLRGPRPRPGSSPPPPVEEKS